jgi:heme/copper-type cytochrome/quinol oxidase subunit 3
MEVSETPGGDRSRLRHLRAAQLRLRAIRGALVKGALGTVFLCGAIAHALSPQRHEPSGLFWMTALILMSTINVGLGLRALARARRIQGRAWLFASGAWALLALVLLGLLLRR